MTFYKMFSIWTHFLSVITEQHCTGIFQKSAKRHHYIAQLSCAIPPASNFDITLTSILKRRLTGGWTGAGIFFISWAYKRKFYWNISLLSKVILIIIIKRKEKKVTLLSIIVFSIFIIIHDATLVMLKLTHL